MKVLLQSCVCLLEDLVGPLLNFLFFETGRQGIELLRGQVVRVILIAVQENHDPAKHTAHFVENSGVLRGTGDNSGVLKSGSYSQFCGLGVGKKIAVRLGLNGGLTAGLRFDGLGIETQPPGQFTCLDRPSAGQPG
jgi:hypothetical protein